MADLSVFDTRKQATDRELLFLIYGIATMPPDPDANQMRNVLQRITFLCDSHLGLSPQVVLVDPPEKKRGRR